nr:DUF748 domain-containing protein [uncultured Holophaga sp.]
MNILESWKKLPRWGHRAAQAVLGILILYSLLGFLLLPLLLRRQLPQRLGGVLHRQVTLQKVRLNPFALSLTLEGLEVKDRDGQPFFGFDRLYVNLKLRSVLGNPAFDAIELDAPHGRVVVGRDGKLNFADLLEGGEPAPKPASPAKPLDLFIGHLKVEGGRFAFQDLSLPRPFATVIGPLGLELTDFRTQRDSRNPYAFQGTMGNGERFAWSGTFSLDPIRSQGRLLLGNLDLPHYSPYFTDRVAFDLKGGRLDVQATYTLAWSEGQQVLKIDDGNLAMKGLVLAPRTGGGASLELPSLELKGARADLLASSAHADSVLLRGLQVKGTRLPGGQIDLVQLLTPRPSPEPEKPSKPFKLTLGTLALEGAKVSFEDRVPRWPVRLDLQDLALHLRDFSLEPQHASQLDLSVRVGEKGTLRAEGELKPLVPSLDLKVQGDALELPPFSPYLQASLPMRVNRGRLGFEGRLRAAFTGRPSDAVTYEGGLGLDEVDLADAEKGESFFRQRALRLGGMVFGTRPLAFRAKTLDLRQPQVLLVVDRDGRSNLDRALGTPVPGATPTGTPVPAAAGTPSGPSPVILLARVSLAGGRLSLLDRSVQPSAVLTLTGLEGSYLGLSTEPSALAKVSLKGMVGGVGPLSLEGRAMPLRHDKDTDLTLSVRNTEMTDGSPYSGKFLGYTIRKGKLELAAHMGIQQRKLDMLSKLTMDQFFLGDKVESPDAMHLPIKLALAILRDRQGVIKLELPVDGNLDDPDFHYGKIIWRAIVNIFTKLAASPFKALGSLFGGGDQDLSLVDFQPGSAVLAPEAAKKLGILVKALHERPALSLELEGVAGEPADGAALRQEALEARLRLAKLQALRQKNPGQTEQPVGAEEREKWLRLVYAITFPQAKDSKEKTPDAAGMEQRLLGAMPVEPGRFAELADARGKAVLAALLAGGQVEPSRVFSVRGGERAAKEGGSRVYFGLK